MYDSLEWQAMQWQKQERRQIKLPAPRSLLLKSAPPLTLSQTPAHPLNNCGVTASFTPGDDSIITTMTAPVTFTSTSTGATTLTWSEVGLTVSNGSTFTWGENQPGLYDIMLVAQNGACTDTAIAYYLIKGVQSADRRNIQAYFSNG